MNVSDLPGANSESALTSPQAGSAVSVPGLCCCGRLRELSRLPLTKINVILEPYGVSLCEVEGGFEAEGWDGRYISLEEPASLTFDNISKFWHSWFRYVWSVMDEVEKIDVFTKAYTEESASGRLRLITVLRDYLWGVDDTGLESFFDEMIPITGCRMDDWAERLTQILQLPDGQSPFGAIIASRLRQVDPLFETLWRHP